MFHRKFKREDQLYVCGCLHLWHRNITRGESTWPDASLTRDFETVKEMTRAVIDSIMALPEESTIFILGDMFFGHKAYVDEVVDKLTAKYKLVYIMGNHCTWFRKQYNLHQKFEFVGDYLEIFWDNKFVTMFHYPISVWNEAHHGSWALCSHSHGSFGPSLPTTYDQGKILDCGWDVHKRPLSFLEVEEIMKKKSYTPVDHHNKATT